MDFCKKTLRADMAEAIKSQHWSMLDYLVRQYQTLPKETPPMEDKTNTTENTASRRDHPFIVLQDRTRGDRHTYIYRRINGRTEYLWPDGTIQSHCGSGWFGSTSEAVEVLAQWHAKNDDKPTSAMMGDMVMRSIRERVTALRLKYAYIDRPMYGWISQLAVQALADAHYICDEPVPTRWITLHGVTLSIADVDKIDFAIHPVQTEDPQCLK